MNLKDELCESGGEIGFGDRVPAASCNSALHRSRLVTGRTASSRSNPRTPTRRPSHLDHDRMPILSILFMRGMVSRPVEPDRAGGKAGDTIAPFAEHIAIMT